MRRRLTKTTSSSSVFLDQPFSPYDPSPLTGLGLKAGDGFTAAFGYAFKEGFSTEIEWGYQKVGIGNPSGLGETIGATFPGRVHW